MPQQNLITCLPFELRVLETTEMTTWRFSLALIASDSCFVHACDHLQACMWSSSRNMVCSFIHHRTTFCSCHSCEADLVTHCLLPTTSLFPPFLITEAQTLWQCVQLKINTLLSAGFLTVQRVATSPSSGCCTAEVGWGFGKAITFSIKRYKLSCCVLCPLSFDLLPFSLSGM